MKRPDRFARMVDRHIAQTGHITFSDVEVVILLRRQHARVVALIKQSHPETGRMVFMATEQYKDWIKRDDLLAALAKIKTGKP